MVGRGVSVARREGVAGVAVLRSGEEREELRGSRVRQWSREDAGRGVSQG